MIGASQRICYTHHLPYGVRRDICNLFDADQSWRTLGGHFMRLDSTQLTLIGQAYLRNGSPTEELFNRLDSANVRIVELCRFLEQMNHHRALEILIPYASMSNGTSKQSPPQDVSLCTPTPSFGDIQPAALISPSEFNILAKTENYSKNPSEWDFLPNSGSLTHDKAQQPRPDVAHAQEPKHCHKTGATNSDHHHNHHHPRDEQRQANEETKRDRKSEDPGEEIVRLACSSNRKRTNITDLEVVNQLRLIMQISYDELKEACDNFSDANVLGNGGFASVYHGCWKGTDVAIKRLKCDLMDQAFNEFTILNSYKIDNILPIYGISIDGPEACLVYQFMANGSLEDRLSCKNGTPPLTWEQRAMIGEGVAKGLYYLHTLRPNKPLVHGDAKSANVLLDSQFVPKLGDFGLARQVFKTRNLETEGCTSITVTSINGTSVYLPQEYLRHKILSPAVDVYSYGIVLLEMATGKRAYDGKKLLIHLVEDETSKVQRGQQAMCHSLQDPRLAENDQSSSSIGFRIWFELLLRLGINCAHRMKKKRPTMGQVLNHFAQFRVYLANSPPDTPVMNHLLDGTNSLISTTTSARTLTPDLTALDTHPYHPLKNVNHQVRPPTNNLQSSAMMSVEEEGGLLEMDHHHQQQQQQLQQQIQDDQQTDDEPAAVEAMIPLLTELGFVAEDESQAMKVT